MSPDRPLPSFKQLFNSLFSRVKAPHDRRFPKRPEKTAEQEPLTLREKKRLRRRDTQTQSRRRVKQIARLSRKINRRRHPRSAHAVRD